MSRTRYHVKLFTNVGKTDDIQMPLPIPVTKQAAPNMPAVLLCSGATVLMAENKGGGKGKKL